METLAHGEPATAGVIRKRDSEAGIADACGVDSRLRAHSCKTSRHMPSTDGACCSAEAKGFSDAQAISIVSINALLGIIGTVLSGWFSDKFKGTGICPP